MNSFDNIILAGFPRGLYLSQALFKLLGKKVCYVELPSLPVTPCPYFLRQDQKEEKDFLESIGTLHQQEGGLCLISPEGMWNLQTNKPKPSSLLDDFSRNFLSSFFETNNQNPQAALNLQAEYYLFQPDKDKLKKFKSELPEICWLESQDDLVLNEGVYKLGSYIFPKEKTFCLVPSNASPYDWIWQGYQFSLSLQGYKSILPKHFVSINCLSSPWTHDNLLSVFYEEPHLSVWCRKPCSIKTHSPEEQRLLEDILEHLKHLFKGSELEHTGRTQASDQKLYGKASFNKPKPSFSLNLGLEEENKILREQA